MKALGAPYKGVLFAGLMITKDGPKLIEYNVRFGDPECQVLMLRLMSDLVPALIASRDGQLRNFDLRWYADAALTVVMATKGYPGSLRQRLRDRRTRCGGADRRRADFSRRHQKRRTEKLWPMAGACSTSARRAKPWREAQQRAYAAVDKIKWPDGFCRRDIGWRAVAGK